MRNHEFSEIGEGDRPQEGEEVRDIGFARKKSKLSPEEDLRRKMDALSGGKPETKIGDREGSVGKKSLAEMMDGLSQRQSETQERSRVIQENDRKEAEELSRKLKEQMSKESRI